ncbi:MAG: YbaB/EbfC family nucleoid-associated protein [Ureaplasma sp.]|nr:YbaB/EbfC family nucleoid-associated protein [Ureaplasma sp.]MDE7221946.1 YbaB/EbfC family nucleoid-associated protein [Ureaplasma sp.]
MNIQKMMQEVQRLQKKIQEFDEKVFDYDYKGYIQFKLNGNSKLISVTINPALVDPEDPETLQDLIVMGFNEAKNFIDSERSKLENSTKGMPKGFF